MDYKKLEEVIKKSSYVYNFAGIADLDYGVSQPIKSIEQNILATVNILNLCKKYKIKDLFLPQQSMFIVQKEAFTDVANKQQKIILRNFIKNLN